MESLVNKSAISNDAVLNFNGSVPEVYETVLGNFIFEPFAVDIVNRISNKNAFNVLELAAGTGRVTKHLIHAFSPNAKIVASDISLPMMEKAKLVVSSQNLTWQQVDIADIPFSEGSFDVIVCQFGVMFLQDKLRAFSEIRRVLKLGGQLLFSTWACIEENPIWKISNQVATKFFGPAPAAIQKSGPFSICNAVDAEAQLHDAGFIHTKVEKQRITSSISSASLAAKGFIHGLPLKDIIIKQNPEILSQIQEEMENSFADHFGNNPLTASFTAFVFEAIK